MKLKGIIFLLFNIVFFSVQAQVNINGAKLLNAFSNPSDTVYNQQYNNSNTHYLNLSVGFFNPVDFAFSLANVNSVSGSPSPSINLDYNYGINSNFSIGVFTNYYRVNAQYTPSLSELEGILDKSLACTGEIDGLGGILDAINCISDQVGEQITIEERLNVFTLGGKVSVHKRFIPKLDAYAATYLGFSFNNRESIVEGVLEEYAVELFERSSVEVPKFLYYINGGIRYYLNSNIGIYGELGYGNVHLAKLGFTYRF